MSKRCATAGRASVSTLATSNRSARSRASFSISGATMRHGPHQAAQKSTSTGRGESPISSSKSCALVSAIGRETGKSAVLQRAHLALSNRRLAGTRFRAEHDAQTSSIFSQDAAAPARVKGPDRDACIRVTAARHAVSSTWRAGVAGASRSGALGNLAAGGSPCAPVPEWPQSILTDYMAEISLQPGIAVALSAAKVRPAARSKSVIHR